MSRSSRCRRLDTMPDGKVRTCTRMTVPKLTSPGQYTQSNSNAGKENTNENAYHKGQPTVPKGIQLLRVEIMKHGVHILSGGDAKQDARFTDAFATRTCLSLEIVPKRNISIDRFGFASFISLQRLSIDPFQFRSKHSPDKCLLPFWTRSFLHIRALSSTCAGQYGGEVLAESTA